MAEHDAKCRCQRCRDAIVATRGQLARTGDDLVVGDITVPALSDVDSARVRQLLGLGGEP